jgi:hypothetical protein
MLKRWAVAVLAFALLGASQGPPPGPTKVGQEPKHQAARENQESANSQRGTYARPLVVEIPPTPYSETKANEEARKEHDSATREWGLVILTGVLTVATIALGVFIYLLWRETAKAVSESAKALQAATTANEIAERSIIEGNRPWVFVENVRWNREEGFITVIFKNSGKSPAKNFCKTIVAHVLPIPFPRSNLPNVDAGSATFLPPDASEIMTLAKPREIGDGYEYRIRIGLTYLVDSKTTDRLDVDFACTRDGQVRKVTPSDYAAYQGKETYTFEL